MLLPKNSQDYVWLSIDNVIFSDGNSLVMTYINTKSEWKILKNSSKFNLSGISRLALLPDRSKIAVVTIMPLGLIKLKIIMDMRLQLGDCRKRHLSTGCWLLCC